MGARDHVDSTGQCVFCGIVAGTIPCAKVAEDEKTFAFMDIDPGSDQNPRITRNAGLAGPEYPDEAWQTYRAMVGDHRGDWLPVFDRCHDAEKRTLAPMLCGLVITQALR